MNSCDFRWFSLFLCVFNFSQQLMGNIVMGAHGGVGTLYNIMPRVFHRLLVHLGNGEMTKAREEQIRAQKILRVMMKYGKGKLWHLQHLELWCFFFIIPNNCYSDCGREIGMYKIIYLLCQGHTLNDIFKIDVDIVPSFFRPRPRFGRECGSSETHDGVCWSWLGPTTTSDEAYDSWRIIGIQERHARNWLSELGSSSYTAISLPTF